MPKYNIKVDVACTITLTIEAATDEAAVEEAYNRIKDFEYESEDIEVNYPEETYTIERI